MTGEVSPVDRPAESPAQAELRASHTDRDRVVELLRVAAGDGRLTAEELDERLEAALTARTYSELAVLTTDLPAAPSALGLAGQAVGLGREGAKELVKIDCGSGSAKRDGQWQVPQRMAVNVASGSVKLDLTRAVISSPALQLDIDVHSGSLLLVTRPGIVVDTDDVAVRSGSVGVKAHRGHNAPVLLRVQVSGRVASGSFKARPPRRTFLQWLLRRPLRYA
ncbi:MAG TPA: DUF1707 domain-containing protein [Streptosporangiaceae bacterium]|nr:DUF1707 domain-containing protein [Streptosporangiaceae bacterium]